MDPMYIMQFRSNSLFLTYYYGNVFVTLLTLQNLLVLGGNSSAVAINEAVLLGNFTITAGNSMLMSTPFHHNHDITDLTNLKECVGCKSGENDKLCSGKDQGQCDCTSEYAICSCTANWIGDACQYKISKISCEKLRSCILCQVHGTGPLADGKDCQYYCNRSYPIPLVVKTLYFQDDEHLCSFIHHHHNATESKSECRYFFKYGKIKANGNLDSSNFHIVAQQSMDCGKKAKFPFLRNSSSIHRNNKSFQVFAKNYEETVKSNETREEIEKKNSFIAIVIVFIFIALPFVTCMFALIYNFSDLPCGLCNMFRQSSSKYLRNVRPFPGFIPPEQITPL